MRTKHENEKFKMKKLQAAKISPGELHSKDNYEELFADLYYYYLLLLRRSSFIVLIAFHQIHSQS